MVSKKILDPQHIKETCLIWFLILKEHLNWCGVRLGVNLRTNAKKYVLLKRDWTMCSKASQSFKLVV